MNQENIRKSYRKTIQTTWPNIEKHIKHYQATIQHSHTNTNNNDPKFWRTHSKRVPTIENGTSHSQNVSPRTQSVHQQQDRQFKKQSETSESYPKIQKNAPHLFRNSFSTFFQIAELRRKKNTFLYVFENCAAGPCDLAHLFPNNADWAQYRYCNGGSPSFVSNNVLMNPAHMSIKMPSVGCHSLCARRCAQCRRPILDEPNVDFLHIGMSEKKDEDQNTGDGHWKL